MHYKSATELASLIRRKKVSALELLDHFLARVDKYNPKLNAIIWMDRASALSMICYPLDTELPDPGSELLVKSVIIVGGFHQALRQSVAEAHDLLGDAGLNVALLEGDLERRWVSFH
jgi:hypothetical protein